MVNLDLLDNCPSKIYYITIRSGGKEGAVGIVGGLLDRWLAFFEGWGFLTAIFERNFLWLPDGVTQALPRAVGVFVLAAIPCHILTVLAHKDDPDDQLEGLFVVGGLTAIVLVILRFFTTGSMDEISWYLSEIVEAFASVGQGFIVLDVLNALVALVLSVICIAFHSLFFIIPAVIVVVEALKERETYGAWAPIAFVGHVGVGFMLVAALTGGVLAVVMFALWCAGPLFAWMLHM